MKCSRKQRLFQRLICMRDSRVVDARTSASVLTEARSIYSLLTPQAFEALPSACKRRLVLLLPKVDSSNDLKAFPISNSALRNPQLRTMCDIWQNLLSQGIFSRSAYRKMLQPPKPECLEMKHRSPTAVVEKVPVESETSQPFNSWSDRIQPMEDSVISTSNDAVTPVLDEPWRESHRNLSFHGATRRKPVSPSVVVHLRRHSGRRKTKWYVMTSDSSDTSFVHTNSSNPFSSNRLNSVSSVSPSVSSSSSMEGNLDYHLLDNEVTDTLENHDERKNLFRELEDVDLRTKRLIVLLQMARIASLFCRDRMNELRVKYEDFA